jgi:hypothetical protein
MNSLTRIPRGLSLRRIALMLMLGLALLAPVRAFALIIIKTTTIYYVLGVEVWRTVTYTVISET